MEISPAIPASKATIPIPLVPIRICSMHSEAFVDTNFTFLFSLSFLPFLSLLFPLITSKSSD